MRTFEHNQVSTAQIDAFENGTANHLSEDSPPFSPSFRKLLDDRRQRPVAKDRQKILDAYHNNQVLVVASPNGSGKTTEIPQLIMFDELASGRLVACTQPRRLAATSVAEFVAKQRDVPIGEEVGYKVRFDNKTKADRTRLLYMTDGMLLAELQSDKALSNYSCVIIDEAHERSPSTELLLTLLRNVLQKRNDLKLVIMSATIDAMKFRKFFARPDGRPAPLLDIGGFSYPVKIYNSKSIGSSLDFIDLAVQVASMIHTTRPKGGDILIFLPGEDEINTTAAKL